jgi:tripartite-type tricarboxylate transporter receptor subunit TctC
MLRRQALPLLLLPLLAALPATPALAQDWPTKPVRLVVPYPPGGNVDIAARTVAEELQKALGQPIVVENRAGAGGMIAAEYVAKSAPDGYTLFVAANGPLLFAPTIFGRPAYHWQKDFLPISTITLTPLVLQVHPSVPAKTVSELLELVRQKPSSMTLASPGAGTTNHLLSEQMQGITGVRWTTIHYKGNAPATNDLLGGQVQFSFDQVSVAQKFVKEGRLRALAVVAQQRLPWLPDVPTLDEQGVKGMDGQTFTGVLAPAGTPAAVVNRVSEALRRILQEPAIVQKFFAIGSEAKGMTPDAFAAYLKREEATWIPIIKAANIKAD